jgi:hypothetical protein
MLRIRVCFRARRKKLVSVWGKNRQNLVLEQFEMVGHRFDTKAWEGPLGGGLVAKVLRGSNARA